MGWGEEEVGPLPVHHLLEVGITFEKKWIILLCYGLEFVCADLLQVDQFFPAEPH